jgi:hypothetical protein
MPKTFAVSLLARSLLLVACGGGDGDEGADGGSEADAPQADYSEENCDSLFAEGVIHVGEKCCYTGGFQVGCGGAGTDGHVIELDDGSVGCIDDKIAPEVYECAFFACETFVDDLAECE